MYGKSGFLDNNYPVLKTEDLLATLGGGNRFMKLDMSQSCLQLELEEGSKKFTTINRYKGLYQHNRLPFGVSSAPGIKQCTVENLLQDIPHVVVRISDILVSGKGNPGRNQRITTTYSSEKKLNRPILLKNYRVTFILTATI